MKEISCKKQTIKKVMKTRRAAKSEIEQKHIDIG
jgi:hypothetical protein